MDIRKKVFKEHISLVCYIFKKTAIIFRSSRKKLKSKFKCLSMKIKSYRGKKFHYFFLLVAS